MVSICEYINEYYTTRYIQSGYICMQGRSQDWLGVGNLKGVNVSAVTFGISNFHVILLSGWGGGCSGQPKIPYTTGIICWMCVTCDSFSMTIFWPWKT